MPRVDAAVSWSSPFAPDIVVCGDEATQLGALDCFACNRGAAAPRRQEARMSRRSNRRGRGREKICYAHI